MDRLHTRLRTAVRALSSLRSLLEESGPPSIVVRDAAIHRFEYTFEAAWKAAQLFLAEVEGLDMGSPKSVVRACREVGLLDEEEAALGLAMVDDRNLTVHTYNEGVAEQIYARLPGYAQLMAAWLERMEEKLQVL
ncbi:MAG: HI0074 family nucleotidyltransferase substrate-binding subunit [Kyrpidia sp.]|nr:HI0074 family nucleotidyltransferase substrate-binding subunit [Kyrpidia sp.]